MTEKEKRMQLIEFSKQILYKKSLPDGLPHISKYAKQIIGADRCSMFIYNPRESQLWTTLSDGVERIVIPSNYGIVGETFQTGKAIIENDLKSNSLFKKDVDNTTGYVTYNLITAPLLNIDNEVIGVFELLNKEDGFKQNDIKYMTFFSRTLSDFIELVNLYEA